MPFFKYNIEKRCIMSDWYKKSKVVDDIELSNLLSKLKIGDQMELFNDPLWDSYTK
jgi:hypothetical protein